MNEKHLSGKTNEIKGNVKSAFGEATNSQDAKASGVVDRAKGAAQSVAGDLKDRAKDLKNKAENVVNQLKK